MSEKLHYGIMGTARVIRKTVPALQETDNGEVVALASRTQEKADEYAKKHGIASAYHNYEDLLDDTNVHAVYIPLPNSLHHEWIMKALQAGKHVLCEKPLAMSAEEVRDIGALALEKNLKVLEGFMYRFHPRWEKVQELLSQEVVGDIKFINIAHTFAAEGDSNIRWYKSLGGGALFDTGCYCVNVARSVTGEEPVSVAAYGNFEEGAEGPIEKSMAAMLRFPGGATALFDCGVNLERRNYIEIEGTKGRLFIDNPFGVLEEDCTIEEHHYGQDTVIHEIAGRNHFVAMGEHFSEAVTSNTPVRYDFKDAENNAKVLEALARAMDLSRNP